MRNILDQDAVVIETESGEATVGWTHDFICEKIRTDRNGVLYVGDGADAKAVGVVVVNRGWNRLAETGGGSLLGNVRNTGWSPYDSREEWEAACGE